MSAAQRFDRERAQADSTLLIGEPEDLAMLFEKVRCQAVQALKRERERGVGTVKMQIGRVLHPDLLIGYALIDQAPS